MMDFSPLAVFKHPVVFCTYCVVTIYLGVCCTLAITLATDCFKGRTFWFIPRWFVVLILAISFSIVLVALLAPYGVAFGVWSLYEHTVRKWYRGCRQWRKSRRSEATGDQLPSYRRNAVRWDSITDLYAFWQSQVPPVYGRHEQDIQLDSDVIDGVPDRPPPAYHPDRHRETVSRQQELRPGSFGSNENLGPGSGSIIIFRLDSRDIFGDGIAVGYLWDVYVVNRVV
ncbi:hypothetical protein K449DRAFT_467591 [Hypoxylon sp. EC38]|nr:hypothetical protein K449DRAFT_467591 [Hypoxylon sp. EC38]